MREGALGPVRRVFRRVGRGDRREDALAGAEGARNAQMADAEPGQRACERFLAVGRCRIEQAGAAADLHLGDQDAQPGVGGRGARRSRPGTGPRGSARPIRRPSGAGPGSRGRRPARSGRPGDRRAARPRRRRAGRNPSGSARSRPRAAASRPISPRSSWLPSRPIGLGEQLGQQGRIDGRHGPEAQLLEQAGAGDRLDVLAAGFRGEPPRGPRGGDGVLPEPVQGLDRVRVRRPPPRGLAQERPDPRRDHRPGSRPAPIRGRIRGTGARRRRSPRPRPRARAPGRRRGPPGPSSAGAAASPAARGRGEVRSTGDFDRRADAPRRAPSRRRTLVPGRLPSRRPARSPSPRSPAPRRPRMTIRKTCRSQYLRVGRFAATVHRCRAACARSRRRRRP